jgi:hypothetical protein
MLKVNQDTKVYILCAPNFATGGPEALHQLGHQLNKMGIQAFMYYYPFPAKGVNPVHKFYADYHVPYVTDVINIKENILIVPETSPEHIFEEKFGLITKVIWWLSVTNYYRQLEPKMRRAKRKPSYWLRKLYDPIQFATLSKIKELNVANIGHSFFSMQHLEKAGITPVGQISDYMSPEFFKKVNNDVIKEDIIIYNPVKNGAYLDKIMALMPTYKWIPLINLTPEQVAQMMNKAKLYVDFGYHPGKERMPREACIMKCCMIIGKEGSAAFSEDMPIPEKYRFDKTDENIPAILETIALCLSNYEEEIKSFSKYRKNLYMEEKQFAQAVQKVFVKTNGSS